MNTASAEDNGKGQRTTRPSSQTCNCLVNTESLERFLRFLAGETGQRTFTARTCHPSQRTGFCPCDGSVFSRLWFYFKAWVLLTALKQPWNGPKLTLLRACGAKVGRNVFISTDVWIDPTFPQLLTIEDDVMIGVGVKISVHEFGPSQFRAGRVVIRRGAVIGGFALIGHGVEIGAGAVVAGGAAVGRDVPPGKLAIGNPARIRPAAPTPEVTSPGAPASLPAASGLDTHTAKEALADAGKDAGAPGNGAPGDKHA